MTLAALARATDIGQEELGHLRSSQQDPTLGQVRALAAALHVSPQVLV